VPGWLSSLRDLIAEASPWRRFTLVLLVVVPLGALTAVYLRIPPPDYRVLYAHLSDRSSGEILIALDQLDIPYRVSPAEGTIEVAADQLHRARYRLAARGLPKTEDERQDESEGAPRFGASSLQEQQRFQRALEIDLARSIQKLETVEIARVHLALPRVSPFLRDAPPATAAVLVRLRQDARLTADQVTTIQTLVAAGVPRMKRSDVEVLDPSGVVPGSAVPELAQSRQLAIEQDLAQRVMAVLTPWLGKDRVSVQVTATLVDSETRETVEQVRNMGSLGRSRPMEKTVRVTRVPEGSIARLQAVVILGFDANANERWRARQMASQALGYQPVRGDSVSVYALPAAAQAMSAKAATPVPPAEQPPSFLSPAVPLQSIPHVRPQSAPPSRAGVRSEYEYGWAGLAAGMAALVMVGIAWRRRHRTAPPELIMDDFDAELDMTRSQVMTAPRVAADVIKLWMRA